MQHEDGINCWTGFKIVGDSLDMNVRSRYRRIDRFHHYAVKDRVNLMTSSDEPNHYLDVITTILPTASDHQQLVHNFRLFISRVLVEAILFFNRTFSDVITSLKVRLKNGIAC